MLFIFDYNPDQTSLMPRIESIAEKNKIKFIVFIGAAESILRLKFTVNLFISVDQGNKKR